MIADLTASRLMLMIEVNVLVRRSCIEYRKVTSAWSILHTFESPEEHTVIHSLTD